MTRFWVTSVSEMPNSGGNTFEFRAETFDEFFGFGPAWSQGPFEGYFMYIKDGVETIDCGTIARFHRIRDGFGYTLAVGNKALVPCPPFLLVGSISVHRVYQGEVKIKAAGVHADYLLGMEKGDIVTLGSERGWFGVAYILSVERETVLCELSAFNEIANGAMAVVPIDGESIIEMYLNEEIGTVEESNRGPTNGIGRANPFEGS